MEEGRFTVDKYAGKTIADGSVFWQKEIWHTGVTFRKVAFILLSDRLITPRQFGPIILVLYLLAMDWTCTWPVSS
jgi:hypothetical protein